MAIKTDLLENANGTKHTDVNEIRDHIDHHPSSSLAWNNAATYVKDTLVVVQDHSMPSALAHKQFFSLTDGNTSNDPLTDTVNWKEDNVVKYLDKDFTITVGPGGDFTDLNICLNYVTKYVVLFPAKLSINILAGYIQEEPVNLAGSFINVDITGTELIFDVTNYFIANPTELFIGMFENGDAYPPAIAISECRIRGTKPATAKVLMMYGCSVFTMPIRCINDVLPHSDVALFRAILNASIVIWGTTIYRFDGESSLTSGSKAYLTGETIGAGRYDMSIESGGILSTSSTSVFGKTTNSICNIAPNVMTSNGVWFKV